MTTPIEALAERGTNHAVDCVRHSIEMSKAAAAGRLDEYMKKYNETETDKLRDFDVDAMMKEFDYSYGDYGYGDGDGPSSGNAPERPDA